MYGVVVHREVGTPSVTVQVSARWHIDSQPRDNSRRAVGNQLAFENHRQITDLTRVDRDQGVANLWDSTIGMLVIPPYTLQQPCRFTFLLGTT